MGRTKGYTKVWKTLHRNTNLTLAERVLLTEILACEFKGAPSPTSPKMLAQNTGLERRTVYALLKKLERAGYILSAPLPKRQFLYTVTDAAKHGEVSCPTSSVTSGDPARSLQVTQINTVKSEVESPQMTKWVTSDDSTGHLRRPNEQNEPEQERPKSVRKRSLNVLKEHKTSDSAKQKSDTKRKKKPTSDPRIKRLIDHYYNEHVRLLGGPYNVIKTHDPPALKRLLITYDEEDLKRRITAYLEEADPWLQQRGLLRVYMLEKRITKYSAPANEWAGPNNTEEALAKTFGREEARQRLQERYHEE